MAKKILEIIDMKFLFGPSLCADYLQAASGSWWAETVLTTMLDSIVICVSLAIRITSRLTRWCHENGPQISRQFQC